MTTDTKPDDLSTLLNDLKTVCDRFPFSDCLACRAYEALKRLTALPPVNARGIGNDLRAYQPNRNEPERDHAVSHRCPLCEGPPPAALPWDHSTNSSYEPVETRAKELYDALEYSGPGKKPAWLPHGNSLKQDEARCAARAELRAAGHVPFEVMPRNGMKVDWWAESIKLYRENKKLRAAVSAAKALRDNVAEFGSGFDGEIFDAASSAIDSTLNQERTNGRYSARPPHVGQRCQKSPAGDIHLFCYEGNLLEGPLEAIAECIWCGITPNGEIKSPIPPVDEATRQRGET